MLDTMHPGIVDHHDRNAVLNTWPRRNTGETLPGFKCFLTRYQVHIHVNEHIATLKRGDVTYATNSFGYTWSFGVWNANDVSSGITCNVRGIHKNTDATVYPKKYAHGFVVLCFVVVMQSFVMNSHELFIHIHHGCFAGTGAIVRLPQCQWSKPDGYGKISQCLTTTKHSKAKTVCIFLGINCIFDILWIRAAMGCFVAWICFVFRQKHEA